MDDMTFNEKCVQCDGKNQNMQRFMEICLLVLLYNKPSHGYSLAEKLGEYGFLNLNVSTLYRTLRKMEKDTWVNSTWEQSGKGPKRRVYVITKTGKQELNVLIKVLELRKSRIEKILNQYEKSIKE